MEQENVVLLLGSNQGDRERLLAEARVLIERQMGTIIDSSLVQQTTPLGFDSPNEFLNQGLVVRTMLDPLRVLEVAQQIETTLGRDPLGKGQTDASGNRVYRDRPIDIDILYYGDRIVQTETLTIPHPGIHQRPFTLSIIRQLRW